MSKTITIEVPKGYEIDTLDRESGAISFKKIPESVLERIKTIEDVYQDNKAFIEEEYGFSVEEFKNSFKHLKKDEVAYRQLKLICRTFNEGWTPNWDDSSEYKYFPWFLMSSSGFRFSGYVDWGTDSSVGSRLCFKSSELAKHTSNLFINIYKEYFL